MGYAIAPAVREVATAPYGWDRIDQVEDLADEIATLAADLHAGKERLLGLVARFDAIEGWKLLGHRSCAHWLAHRASLDLVTAREHVRVARRLVELPLTTAAMSRGELSFSQVRALTRVARPENEEALVELACGCTTQTLERMVRAWKKGTRREEADRERVLHELRRLAVFPDEDGMYVVMGLVEPEVGIVLQRGLEASEDALYRQRGPAPVGPSRPGRVTASERAAAQRRADALGLLAERALAAGFGESGSRRSSCRGESDGHGGSDAAPISGTRAERYQVVLHVEEGTLAADGEPGMSELEDGTRISAESSRRLSCDSALIRMTRSKEGRVLDVGRKTRTIPPALRRALEVRDRGCRFPGCGSRFTEAHHVVHWADGGATSLENTVLLCRYHHRLVHEEGWTLEWWGVGRPAFRDPRGSVHLANERAETGAPSGSRRSDARVGNADALVTANRERGVAPDGWTAGPRWNREVDIPDHVLFRATEAAL